MLKIKNMKLTRALIAFVIRSVIDLTALSSFFFSSRLYKNTTINTRNYVNQQDFKK